MHNLKLIFLFFFFAFSTSCFNLKVPGKYTKQVPFSINDILVFKNNQNLKLDTFYIYNYDNGLDPYMQRRINKRYYLTRRIVDSSILNYNEFIFINCGDSIIHHKNSNEYKLYYTISFGIDFRLINTKPDNYNAYKFNEFSKMPQQQYIIFDKTINDIVKIKEENGREIYWSKSFGYVQINYPNGIEYKLIEKFNSKQLCEKLSATHKFFSLLR